MSKRYRANWRLTGLKGKDAVLHPGDTIELTEEEAAPYIGGVLSLASDPEPVPAAGTGNTVPPAEPKPKGKGKKGAKGAAQ